MECPAPRFVMGVIRGLWSAAMREKMDLVNRGLRRQELQCHVALDSTRICEGGILSAHFALENFGDFDVVTLKKSSFAEGRNETPQTDYSRCTGPKTVSWNILANMR